MKKIARYANNKQCHAQKKKGQRRQKLPEGRRATHLGSEGNDAVAGPLRDCLWELERTATVAATTTGAAALCVIP